MAKAGMKMGNPEALTAGLRTLSTAVSESTLRQAAVAGARVFLEEERLRIPVKTGKGRDGLIIAFDPEASLEGVIASYIVTWTKEVYYLKFIEFGRSDAAAQPFKRPAFEAKKTDAARAVDDVLNAAINGKVSG